MTHRQIHKTKYMITVDYVAIAGNMLAMIATRLAKHTLTLWVTLVPMEINTINGENNSPEVRLVVDREEKNGCMIL